MQCGWEVSTVPAVRNQSLCSARAVSPVGTHFSRFIVDAPFALPAGTHCLVHLWTCPWNCWGCWPWPRARLPRVVMSGLLEYHMCTGLAWPSNRSLVSGEHTQRKRVPPPLLLYIYISVPLQVNVVDLVQVCARIPSKRCWLAQAICQKRQSKAMASIASLHCCGINRCASQLTLQLL